MKKISFYFLKFIAFLLIILIIYINNIYESLAWNGFDFDSNSNISIDMGNTVRTGHVIEFYDSSVNNYKTANVLSIRDVFNDTELIVLDLDSQRKDIYNGIIAFPIKNVKLSKIFLR